MLGNLARPAIKLDLGSVGGHSVRICSAYLLFLLLQLQSWCVHNLTKELSQGGIREQLLLRVVLDVGALHRS
jgi:hypothetical protein